MRISRANFLLALFLFALPSISIAQLGDKKKTVELLCHTWTINTAKNPKKMDCFPPEADSTIYFGTNGYVIFSERKGAEGVWNYDANRNNFYVIISGTLWKYKIRSITETELAFESTNSKTVAVYYLSRKS